MTRIGTKCPVGCKCGRHSQKCALGCTCKKHSNRGVAVVCPEGCNCGRHTFTEERKQKISEAQKKVWNDLERRNRQSEQMKSSRNNPNSPLSVLGQTEEVNQRRSVSGKKVWSLGLREELVFFKGSGQHNGVWMRCLNSEGVFARELDEAGIQWDYEPKRFKLSACTYLPDFYLPEFDIWVEVKGWMDPTSQKKIDSFRQETGKTLVVVMQRELASLSYRLKESVPS